MVSLPTTSQSPRTRTGFFVNLNGRPVSFDSNDLSYQVVVANFNLYADASSVPCIPMQCATTYKFVHSDSNHVLGNHDGAMDS